MSTPDPGAALGGTVVVVAGGDPPSPVDLPAGAHVVAADSGIGYALAAGLHVHHAIGDFDSAPSADVDTVAAAGGLVERHPAAKDATDLELALLVARERAPERIIVLGGHGGRFDHWLANATLLAAPWLAGVDVVAHMGAATLTVVRRRAVLVGAPGETVSLLPVHGAALGVATTGLRYPLDDEDLPAGTTRGVSNVFTGTEAVVTARAGCLLAVQPGRS